jgi:hypothetical protein
MNNNILMGIKCPACGSEGPFFIEVKTQVLMSDDGSDDSDGDHHWDGDSYMRCFDCDREGQAKEFYLVQESHTPEKSEVQTFADTILRMVQGDPLPEGDC